MEPFCFLRWWREICIFSYTTGLLEPTNMDRGTKLSSLCVTELHKVKARFRHFCVYLILASAFVYISNELHTHLN